MAVRISLQTRKDVPSGARREMQLTNFTEKSTLTRAFFCDVRPIQMHADFAEGRLPLGVEWYYLIKAFFFRSAPITAASSSL